ncbi:hypothetical protein HFN65_31215 [Rhizobium laguerreae]|uniref:hypothetical protein n=1 Tax=Rhizobium TaxID=379 RepID=UPI001C90F730|nr:hypothetical protein [Rhizobium laguerreae]MBY3575409.1 hypothetical protein [Rhizobium laguerreae]
MLGLSKHKPEDDYKFHPYLLVTNEKFVAFSQKRFEQYEAAKAKGIERKPSGKGMSPKDAYDEALHVGNMRNKLIERGWLPPRDQDILELGFMNFPSKWQLSRTYTAADISFGNLKYYFDGYGSD